MNDPAPVRLRLGRSMRLERSVEFARLRATGRRITKGCLILNWSVLPAGSLPRVGVITSRKVGKANVRSRARRLLRETFRLHQHELREPVAMALIARNSIVGCTQAEVGQDYLAALRQAGLLKAQS